MASAADPVDVDIGAGGQADQPKGIGHARADVCADARRALSNANGDPLTAFARAEHFDRVAGAGTRPGRDDQELPGREIHGWAGRCARARRRYLASSERFRKTRCSGYTIVSGPTWEERSCQATACPFPSGRRRTASSMAAIASTAVTAKIVRPLLVVDVDRPAVTARSEQAGCDPHRRPHAAVRGRIRRHRRIAVDREAAEEERRVEEDPGGTRAPCCRCATGRSGCFRLRPWRRVQPSSRGRPRPRRGSAASCPPRYASPRTGRHGTCAVAAAARRLG